MRLFKIKITDLDGLDTWACAAYRTVRAQEFLRTPDEDEAETYGPLQARGLAGRYLAEVSAVRGVALIEVGRVVVAPEPAPLRHETTRDILGEITECRSDCRACKVDPAGRVFG